MCKKISPKFNRAVLFDTTMQSWHGIVSPIDCPDTEYRKSLATYYLTIPEENVDSREKALFTTTAEQANDPEIQALIKDRANAKTAAETYKK